MLACVGACQHRERQLPNLQGTWAFDPARVDDLYEVASVPKGPERVRARERILRARADLRVIFGPQDVVLDTGSSKRTVPYRVLGLEGSMLKLEAMHGRERVTTEVMVEGDVLTWFDTSGQIELALRKVHESQ